MPRRLAAQQRHGDAAALVERAQADLAAHRTWLSELADFRAALLRDAAALHTRTRELDAAIADAYVITEALERDQDPSCVEGVRATVDEASAARKALDGALRTIEQHTSMADQQFARAARSSPRRRSPRTPSRRAPRTRRCGWSSCGRSRSTCRSASSGPSWRPTRSRGR